MRTYVLSVTLFWLLVVYLSACTSLPDAEEQIQECKVCTEGACWFIPAWDCSKVEVPEPRRTRKWFDDYVSDEDGGAE